MSDDDVVGDGLPDLSNRPTSHPDAQATVTDFLDYTEYFPSDLVRSLTLIRQLDEKYLSKTQEVHELTKLYGSLPEIPVNERPNPGVLRKQISDALNSAIHCRDAALAEASRLSEVAHRHSQRIAIIKRKLQLLPQPPSRDPTPPPISPQTARRKAELERTPRITLHPESSRPSGGRADTIPGDVGHGGYSPYQEGMSDWEDDYESPRGTPEPTSARKRGKLGTIKIPKTPKMKTPKVPRQRIPGMGTNVHSAVAGISTSNALAKLSPPPADAQPGSKWAPWFKLTEYEMAVLRKTMKKNAIWNPSDTMIRRELTKKGRGRENYEKAKAHSEATGEPFIDEDPVDPGKKVLGPGETSSDPWGKDDSQLINRGMKLNEAKKLKKETMAREQAIRDAMEIEEASRRIAEAGNVMKTLFNKVETRDVVTVTPKKDAARFTKKRKRDPSPEPSLGDHKDTIAAEGESMPHTGPKKLKIAPPVPPQHTQVPPPTTATRTSIPPPEPSRETTPHMSKGTTMQVPLAPAGPSTPATENVQAAPQPVSPTETKRTPIPVPANAILPAQTPTPAVTTAASRTRRTSTVPLPSNVNPVTASPEISTASVATSAEPASVPALTITPDPAPGVAPESEAESRQVPARGPAQDELAAQPPPKASTPAPAPTGTAVIATRPRSSRAASAASIAASSAKASSAEPPATRSHNLRRGSNASLPTLPEGSAPAPTSVPATMPVVRTSGRTTRKPAPGGAVEAGEDGKPKFARTKRSARPRKATGTAASAVAAANRKGVPDGKAAEPLDEIVDPNEQRYCYCNDVSYGTMIACENAEVSDDEEYLASLPPSMLRNPRRRSKSSARQKLRLTRRPITQCEREWFHLECVGLTDIPPRRQKWYCEDCKKKLGIESQAEGKENGRGASTGAAERSGRGGRGRG